MHRSTRRALLIVTAAVLSAPRLAAADGPDPAMAPSAPPPPPAAPVPAAAPAKPAPPSAPVVDPDSRAALTIPDDLWARALEGLGLARDATLGFPSDQMAQYGRDVFVTRPIATMFRDVRAIPRTSGKLSDSILEAAKDPSELVRIAFGLTDAVAGRMLERPKGAAWGVDWLPESIAPEDAYEKVIAHLYAVDPRAGSPPESPPEAKRAWRALPGPLQRFIVRILVGCAEGAPWMRSALDVPFLEAATGTPAAASSATRLLALAARPFLDDDDDAKSADRAATRASFELPRRFDRDAMAFGCVVALLHLSVGLEEWRAARGAIDVRKLLIERTEWPTPLGPIRLLGPGDDVDEAGVEPALLEVDLGGDDVHRGRHAVPASLTRPISLAVDLAGNDRYEAGSTNGTLGCGLFGLGALIDLGGDDVYEGRESCFGAGWYGAGLLYDEAGNDRYVGTKWTQAVGHVGVGVLCDLAGNDTYECAQQAQAMGSTLGAGVLLDVAGDDVYLARDDGNKEKIYLDQSVAMAQGCGFGRRADLSDGHSWAGGIGVLVDGAGNDKYHAQVWSQGCGYWWAAGMLEDRGGDDVYESGKYSLGAGAHFAIGCQVDLAGDDKYNVGVETAVDQYQGHARDGSIGISIDGGGNDVYRLRNHCAGAGDLCSIGLFWDRRGDDLYDVRWNDLGPPNGWTETPPFGAATVSEASRSFRDDLRTFGLFLDTGGHDTYRWDVAPTQAAKDDATWTRRNGPTSFGFGLDTDRFAAAGKPGSSPAR